MKAPRSYTLLLNGIVVILLVLFSYLAGDNIFAQKTKQKLQDDKKKLEADIATQINFLPKPRKTN